MSWTIRTPFGWLNVQSMINGVDPTKILGTFDYGRNIAQGRFSIRLAREARLPAAQSYRSRMARKGIYLGHHSGPPGYVDHTVDSLTIGFPSAKSDEVSAIFWSYAIKLYLGVEALRNGAVHLKAATIRHPADGAIDVLVGRGGGGKTKLARMLAQEGFIALGNTHAIVADDYVWAINTWARIRESNHECYCPPASGNLSGDGRIRRIIVVDHNCGGVHQAELLSSTEVRPYLNQYSLGLGAYDLKEDLHDVFGGVCEINRLWKLEAEAFSRILSQTPCWYLSSDIESSECRASVLRFFQDEE